VTVYSVLTKVMNRADQLAGKKRNTASLKGFLAYRPHEKIAIRRTMTPHTKNASHPRRDATTEDMRPHIPGQMTRTIERRFTNSGLWRRRFLQVAGRSAGPGLPHHQGRKGEGEPALQLLAESLEKPPRSLLDVCAALCQRRNLRICWRITAKVPDESKIPYLVGTFRLFGL
jgi:hypothetical protein